MKQRQIEVDEWFDLALTVRSARVMHGEPALRVENDAVWRATHTPQGPATMLLRQRGDRVDAGAWGEGADWCLERLPALLGLDDQGALAFEPREEPLRTLSRRYRGLRAASTGRMFEALLPAILGQKVAGKEAGISYRHLVRELGERAPGPHRGLRLPPRAERLAALAYEDLHPFGIERRRAETILGVARRSRRIEEVVGLPAEERLARLELFPGIGHWTAAIALWPACGDTDAVPIGDYNLPSMVAWNLAGEPRADDRRMLLLLEPYRGQRARVIRLLELGGRHPPRYGPRHALRRIATA